MKRLFIIRHAKSDWTTGESDHDRPLNKRGLRDAPMMARLLAEGDVRSDLIVSSTARRARMTASFFAQALQVPEERFWTTGDLYLASANEILEVIQELPAEMNTVMVFGHNPGMTYLSNLFLGSERMIDNLPTCGITEVAGEVKNWAMFSPHTATAVRCLFPKMFK